MNTRKRIEAGKDGDNHEKAQYNFMNNVVYGKTMKKIRNRIDVELLNKNKKKSNGHRNQAIRHTKSLTII